MGRDTTVARHTKARIREEVESVLDFIKDQEKKEKWFILIMKAVDMIIRTNSKTVGIQQLEKECAPDRDTMMLSRRSGTAKREVRIQMKRDLFRKELEKAKTDQEKAYVMARNIMNGIGTYCFNNPVG